MKPFKTRAFATEDRNLYRIATRELGHGLQVRSLEELAAIRSQLFMACDGEASEHRRAYIEAIDDVLAGYTAEAKHRIELARDTINGLENALGQLRHLYTNLIEGRVGDPVSLANFLLAAEIRRLEEMHRKMTEANPHA